MKCNLLVEDQKKIIDFRWNKVKIITNSIKSKLKINQSLIFSHSPRHNLHTYDDKERHMDKYSFYLENSKRKFCPGRQEYLDNDNPCQK